MIAAVFLPFACGLANFPELCGSTILESCISSIFNSSLFLNRSTVVHLSNARLVKLLHKLAGLVIMADGFEKSTYTECLPADFFLLEAGQENNVILHCAWNPRGRFILLTNSLEESKLSVSRLNAYKVMDITFLLWSLPRTSVQVLAWFPFHPDGNCGRNYAAIHLINEYRDFKFNNNLDLFPSKFPKDYLGCRITASTFVLEPFILSTTVSDDGVMSFTQGLEVQVLLTATNKLNLTVQFLPQTGKKWGWFSPDGKWSGIFGDVQDGLADVAFAGLFIDIFNSRTFDGTIPYYKENLKFFVPVAGTLPRWTNVFRMYSYTIWLGILISLVVGSFSMWIFANRKPFRRTRNVCHKEEAYLRIESCFRCSFLSLLGASVNRMPKTWILRVYFLPWVFYCMLINTGYQSMLISMLANPGTEHQIKNLDEILASGLKIGFSKTLEPQLHGDSKLSVLPKISETVEDFNEALSRVAYDRDFAYVLAEYTVNFMSINSFRDSSYKPLLYPAEDVIVSFHMSMVTQKGSWLVNVLNKVISHILVSGLQKKWWQDLQLSQRKVDSAMQSGNEAGVVAPLSVVHLQGAFLIFAAGILISSFTFCIEKSFTKISTKIPRK